MNLLNELEIQYVCCFCGTEMFEEQIFCCDTYKGKVTLEYYEDNYYS
jgi:hypothetical protein